MGARGESDAEDPADGAPLLGAKDGTNGKPLAPPDGAPGAAPVAGSLAWAARGRARVVLAAAVSVAWMAVSSLLILLNRYILKELNFPYPMTVSSMGMFATGVCSFLVCKVFKLSETVADSQVTPRFYVTRMLPVGMFMALTLWTGNTVYLYLTVSFIQMLKAFTPVITMVALFLARLEKPGARQIGSVVVIALGTAVAAYGEIAFDAAGVLIMLVSEVAEAVRLVMTQHLLVGLRMGPFEGTMYLGPACFAWLTLGAAFSEWPHIREAGAWAVPRAHPVLFVTAALTGFAINVLGFATIKLASSLTLKVLGTVKNALLVVAAMILFGELVTGLQAVGYLLSVGAFGLYTYQKALAIAAAA